MNQNRCCISCTNFFIMILFSSIAVVASVSFNELGNAVKFGEDEEDLEKYWIMFTVFLNAVVVAALTKFFDSIVSYIVNRENHGQDAEFENSMTQKSLVISSFISFSGLLLAAYRIRSFWRLNLLMIFLIVFKQILLNMIEACKPASTYPKKFEAHKKKFKPHFRKFPNDYEVFSKRQQHYEAEQQTLMGEMSATRIEGYNELFIEYGWLVLFPPVFPAAALIAILSNAIQYKTEKNGILKYNKRCEPRAAIDIGNWLYYFEMISVMGIINGACLIIFTSQKLTTFDTDGTRQWADLILAILMIENILIVFKNLLGALIPDNPDWIEKEMLANEHRVKQVEVEIADKIILQLNDSSPEGIRPKAFVE